jgi:esterase/lipase superfamily enzyme
MFGERPNINGPAEVRLAWAEKQGRKWSVSLVPEKSGMLSDSLPSKNVFKEFKKLLVDAGKNCVFYVHGYNQDFKESLSEGWDLQKRYGVGVIVFSWASNPGGIPPLEYPKARAIAGASSPAIDMTLEKLGRYLSEEADPDCPISLNLLTHSLGNYLFQRFVEKPLFAGETRIFDNLVLHQADVDNGGHELWVDKLRYARRIYVTINENDKILDISDVVNPDRLGNTASGLVADRAIYLDFTDADKVRKSHQLFGKPADKNSVVKDYFTQILNGKPGERISGIRFNPGKNAYDVS